MADQRYNAQPLECFQKGKELRLGYFESFKRAREEGKLIVHGSLEVPMALLAGLGDFVYLCGEVYGANIGMNHDFCLRAMGAIEVRGYARDMCGYFRNDVGSMFLNRYLFGGGYPRPDFCLTYHDCEPRGRWWQVIANHYGVPFFCIEFPVGEYGTKIEQKRDYVTAQLHDCIEWMERITGRKYDDEKLIEAVRTTFRSMKLWGETVLMAGEAVPAALKLRWIFSLMALPFLRRHEKEAAAWLEELRDEVKYRVAHHIGATPWERQRLMLDSMPPWQALDVFKYAEQEYGVNWIGVWAYTVAASLLEEENGRLVAGKTPEERGLPLKTRSDALRALADVYAGQMPYFKMYYPNQKDYDILRLARQWHADGVVLHFNRTCPGCSLGLSQTKLTLRDAGIPVTGFEAAGADPREINRIDIVQTLDRFMEVLGVSRLKE